MHVLNFKFTRYGIIWLLLRVWDAAIGVQILIPGSYNSTQKGVKQFGDIMKAVKIELQGKVDMSQVVKIVKQQI